MCLPVLTWVLLHYVVQLRGVLQGVYLHNSNIVYDTENAWLSQYYTSVWPQIHIKRRLLSIIFYVLIYYFLRSVESYRLACLFYGTSIL